MLTTGQYYLATTQEIVPSFFEVRRRFPAHSLPSDVDIPELGLFLIHQEPYPSESPEEGNAWRLGEPEVTGAGAVVRRWQQEPIPESDSPPLV